MQLRTFTLLLALLFFVSAPAHAIIVAPAAPATTTNDEAAALEAAKAYKASLAAMTPAERRAYKKAQKHELKETIRQYKADVKSGARAADTSTILLVILAILLPPLAVFLYEEAITTKFWISLLLTLLLFVPGIIYAILVVTGNAKKK